MAPLPDATYTGISGNSKPISRTTEVICELMTTNSTSAIAGTGSQEKEDGIGPAR